MLTINSFLVCIKKISSSWLLKSYLIAQTLIHFPSLFLASLCSFSLFFSPRLNIAKSRGNLGTVLNDPRGIPLRSLQFSIAVNAISSMYMSRFTISVSQTRLYCFHLGYISLYFRLHRQILRFPYLNHSDHRQIVGDLRNLLQSVYCHQ